MHKAEEILTSLVCQNIPESEQDAFVKKSCAYLALLQKRAHILPCCKAGDLQTNVLPHNLLLIASKRETAKKNCLRNCMTR